MLLTTCPDSQVTGSVYLLTYLLNIAMDEPGYSSLQVLPQTTSSVCENVFCFQHTSAISALDVLRQCALQIYILLTYSDCLFSFLSFSTSFPYPLLNSSIFVYLVNEQ